MNEQGSFLNERFQSCCRAVDLIDDDEKDHSQSISHSWNDRQLNLIEDQTGEKTQKNRHNDLRRSDRWISHRVSQRSLSHVEELIESRSMTSFVGQTRVIADDIGFDRWLVWLRIGVDQHGRTTLRAFDQNVQGEISGIVVIFASKAERTEVGNDAGRWAKVNGMAWREKKNRIE